MRALSLRVILAAALPTSPATAQDVGDLTAAAQGAVEALTAAAQDKLLVRDLLGANVTGPDGIPVGTVENLVVIPGGRVVAAIVAVRDGDERIPVPFSLVRLASGDGTVDLTLPVGLAELQGSPDIQALGGALPGR